MKKIVVINSFIVLSKIAVAQSGDMVTDRPDITESAEVVPTGWLQAEHGFQYTFSYHPQFDFASSLFRFGVNTHTELRLGIEPSISFNEPNTFYNQQLNIGAKSILLNHAQLKLALLTTIGSGFTQSEIYNKNNSADVLLLGDVDLFDFWSVGFNVGGNWQSDVNGTTLNYSISNALALGEFVGYFIEIFGQFSRFDTNVPAIDVGFTYLLKKNLQIDLSGGYYFCDETTFLSTGFAYRFEL